MLQRIALITIALLIFFFWFFLYYRLAKIHHPDASNGADTIDRFRLICSSYEILKDEQLRADYLLQKNGHSWERKGTSQYNNAQSDFQRAQRVANKQSESHYFIFLLMELF
jgi:DnaJ-class molecular chaperone